MENSKGTMDSCPFLYAKAGKQEGPVSWSEVCAMVANKDLPPNTLVWTTGMPEWKAFNTITSSLSLPSSQPHSVPSHKDQHKQTRNKRRRREDQGQVEVTAVYVRQIPADATEEEVASHFSKCGLIEKHPETGKPCVKLYVDGSGQRKGDGVVLYSFPASVENAILLLDNAPFRHNPETKLLVERASKQPRFGLDAGKRKKHRQALTWEDEQAAPQVKINPKLRTVVLKNVFDAMSSEVAEPEFKSDLEQDILEECEKIGAVTRVVVYEKHEEGVVLVKFDSAFDAYQCVQVMNGRWFDNRQIKAEFWDGKTEYQPAQTPVFVSKNGEIQDSERADQDELDRLDALAADFEQ